MAKVQSPCNVLMVYPRFSGSSFWSYGGVCELIGAKHPAPPLGLITVAAMLPDTWTVRLIDCNTGSLTDGDLDWADMLMTGGMLPQQRDALALLARAKAHGVPTVVGGPDATSSPAIYAIADFRILGEAEGIIDEFVAAWDEGARAGTYESPKFQVDVTTSPIPRFDLLVLDDYIQMGVQFSRGCPFSCEFCDIIELYGRVPRLKTPEQVLSELQTLYDLGYRGHVDIVDDNFIGNKKVLKSFLPELARWQEERNYPFEFSTEASLNLADDPVLLRMMTDAGLFAVFIGIESPDPDVLAATQKKQNTRRDIARSVHKIYDAGIFVVAGFIVGFDSEDGSVAAPITQLIQEAAIPVSMVGLLYALPNTQLTRRLEREGRLHSGHDVDETGGDQCTSGLNFQTHRSREDILTDFRDIVRTIYEPDRYFDRVRQVGSMLNLSGANGNLLAASLGKDLKLLARLAWGLTVRQPRLRRAVWSTLVYFLWRNPRAVKPVLKMLALYVHLGPFSEFVTLKITEEISSLENRRPPVLAERPIPSVVNSVQPQ